MPIWGERVITWRQIVPAVLVVTAVACVGYMVYSCRRGTPPRPRAEQVEDQLRLLKNANSTVVAAAIRQLGDLAEPGEQTVVAPIREKLDSKSTQVVGAACAALGKLGDADSADRILGFLNSEDPVVLAGAAEGIGALYAKDTQESERTAPKEAVSRLCALLAHPDYTIRLQAIVALGKIRDPAALPKLEERHKSPCGGLAGEDTLPDDVRQRIQDALEKAAEATRNPT